VTEWRPFLACYGPNRGAEMLRDFSALFYDMARRGVPDRVMLGLSPCNDAESDANQKCSGAAEATKYHGWCETNSATNPRYSRAAQRC
jgi:hypothetical protein